MGPGATDVNQVETLVISQFQSSPGFGAGRYGEKCADAGHELLFQSSPGFGAGRYPRQLVFGGSTNVFQSSPGFGAGRYHLRSGNRHGQIGVSILARLWGRALQTPGVVVIVRELFQSSPGFGAGRYDDGQTINSRSDGFNPRPALGPGATCESGKTRLIRYSFNPRPALGPGATSLYAPA